MFRPVNLPTRALVALVRAYQLLLSPWLGQGCRFEPTCSNYALQALREHGALRGLALALWRIARCQPGCKGGPDPVPQGPWKMGHKMGQCPGACCGQAFEGGAALPPQAPPSEMSQAPHLQDLGPKPGAPLFTALLGNGQNHDCSDPQGRTKQ